MPRVRICFSKTGLACFISHTDLPMLFARAARRAGLKPEQTQGFSPHPRIVLAPPLPVGVVGLREPADFWFLTWQDVFFPAWRDKMPAGVRLLAAEEITDPREPSLTKLCSAASYRIFSTAGVPAEAIAEALEGPLRESEDLLGAGTEAGLVFLTVRGLERNGPSRMVRILTEAGLAREWSELSIVRTGLGEWDGSAGQLAPIRQTRAAAQSADGGIYS